jgi:hypothetical protein
VKEENLVPFEQVCNIVVDSLSEKSKCDVDEKERIFRIKITGIDV